MRKTLTWMFAHSSLISYYSFCPRSCHLQFLHQCKLHAAWMSLLLKAFARDQEHVEEVMGVIGVGAHNPPRVFTHRQCLSLSILAISNAHIKKWIICQFSKLLGKKECNMRVFYHQGMKIDTLCSPQHCTSLIWPSLKWPARKQKEKERHHLTMLVHVWWLTLVQHVGKYKLVHIHTRWTVVTYL